MFALILPLLASSLFTGCGGCPWVESSEVTITPAQDCLSLSIADSSGDSPSTGCVDPVIHGNNNCTETLTFDASYATNADQIMSFEAGTEVVFEVLLESGSSDGETFTAPFAFDVPATLGDTEILVSFTTSR